MISAKEKEWQPDEEAICWAKDMLRLVKDQGTWISDNGVCQVDHKTKTLALVAKPPWFDKELHAMNMKTFNKVGYKLVIKGE